MLVPERDRRYQTTRRSAWTAQQHPQQDAGHGGCLSTSASPVLFAGMENTDGAFGYLSKRLQMRDCGLFGRPCSHDPLLAIWLDGFDPIGAAEWNDPVGLHEVDIATIRFGRNACQRLDRGGHAASAMTIRRSSRRWETITARAPRIVRQWFPHGSPGQAAGRSG